MKIIFSDKHLEKIYYDESYNPKGYHPDILETMIEAIDVLAYSPNLKNVCNSHAFQCKPIEGKYKKHKIYRMKLTRGWRLFFKLQEDGTIQIVNILEINNHDYNFTF